MMRYEPKLGSKAACQISGQNFNILQLHWRYKPECMNQSVPSAICQSLLHTIAKLIMRERSVTIIGVLWGVLHETFRKLSWQRVGGVVRTRWTCPSTFAGSNTLVSQAYHINIMRWDLISSGNLYRSFKNDVILLSWVLYERVAKLPKLRKAVIGPKACLRKPLALVLKLSA